MIFVLKRGAILARQRLFLPTKRLFLLNKRLCLPPAHFCPPLSARQLIFCLPPARFCPLVSTHQPLFLLGTFLKWFCKKGFKPPLKSTLFFKPLSLKLLLAYPAYKASFFSCQTDLHFSNAPLDYVDKHLKKPKLSTGKNIDFKEF